VRLNDSPPGTASPLAIKVEAEALLVLFENKNFETGKCRYFNPYYFILMSSIRDAEMGFTRSRIFQGILNSSVGRIRMFLI